MDSSNTSPKLTGILSEADDAPVAEEEDSDLFYVYLCSEGVRELRLECFDGRKRT